METHEENQDLRSLPIEEDLRRRMGKDHLALEQTLPLILGHLSDVISTGESPGKKKVWIDFESSSLEDIVAEFDQLKSILLEKLGPLCGEEKNKVIETILYYMGLSAWEFSKQSNVFHQRVEKNLLEEINQEKQEKAWFEKVLDSLPVGIVIVERTTANLLFVNKAAVSFAGGTYPIDLPPDGDQEFFCTDASGKRLSRNELPRFRVARGEKLCGYELTAHYPGGKTTVVIHSDIIAAENGHPERIVLAFQEIEERKKWEEGKKAEVKDLKEERTLREAFVAMLTHDLRTPLSVARMHTELLARKVEEPEYISRCRNVIIHIDMVDRMIQDLLDANKLKAGEAIPIQPCYMCLNDIVKDALSDYRDLHGNRFFLTGKDGVCGYWCGKAMRRMLDNLLSNAVKYGDPEGPVEVNVHQDEVATKLSVHNFGPSIPKYLQKSLFEPFKRAGNESKAGWGIGLALVKGLVESHHGEVNLESSKEAGTTFELRFPNRVDSPYH